MSKRTKCGSSGNKAVGTLHSAHSLCLHFCGFDFFPNSEQNEWVLNKAGVRKELY